MAETIVGEKGSLPGWLNLELESDELAAQRLEIEVKFLLPAEVGRRVAREHAAPPKTTEQAYLPPDVWPLVEAYVPDADVAEFEEWRVRKSDDHCTLTGKARKGSSRTTRREVEVTITAADYACLAAACTSRLEKIRSSFSLTVGERTMKVELDEYRTVAGRPVDLDFWVCEVEVSAPQLAHALEAGRLQMPGLSFLDEGVDVAGIKALSNKALAEAGFPAETLHDMMGWLRRTLLKSLDDALSRSDLLGFRRMRTLIQASCAAASVEGFGSDSGNLLIRTQGTLADLAFGIEDSLGRPDTGNPLLRQLDAAGRGWIRDYQAIISSPAYLRLFSKPQVFRPGVGNTNTTTRGAHTQDVVACSMYLCRQLGLNVDLAAAIGALHDLGHPAGGHIGEDELGRLSGRSFKHNIFSLSLAELFDLNLLREVQVGALFHKTGGEKLRAPPHRPEEFGALRVADKICYTAWDMFDSIMNGFLDRQEVEGGLFETLGESAFDWIQTMMAAAVAESAESFCVSFTAASGPVYQAYKTARQTVFERIHTRIDWTMLKATLGLAYHLIERSFPDLDPVPIIAYMTDTELIRVAQMAESRPKDTRLPLAAFADAGMGFTEIIERLAAVKSCPTRLYYSSAPASTKRRPPET